MRTRFAVTWAAALLTAAMTAAASTTTTPATGGTNISADLAQNGAAPAFTTLGSIVIAEASNNDFRTSGTLVLSAPAGWQFNAAAAVTATPGKVGGGSTPNDISASVGAVTSSSITINITVTASARLDNLTLSGIQVQALEAGNLPPAANIVQSSANPGTATIIGVTNDATNFGSLSLAHGALRLHVVLPGQSFTDGNSVAASGISGAAANQAAGVAFNLVELVAADREFNVDATYGGAKTLTWSGAGGSPSFTSNVSFTAGHSTTPLATTLRKAESLALAATSATSPAIATGLPSAGFAVDAGPAARLQVLLPGETAAPGTLSGKTGAPAAQTIGAAILNNVRVNAVDANWNMVAGATPDVAIASSDAAATIADDNGAAAGNLTLAGGTGALSSFSFGTGGATQTITASDAAAALSAGTSAAVTVNKLASATSVSSSLNPAVFGQSVTFQATVTGGAGTPTGTVDFKDGATVIASARPLDGSAVASFTTSSLSAATHTITAVYSGNAGYNGSTSANLSQVVNKAATSTALASSLNPSCAGSPVTLSASVTVVAPGAGTLTGTVNFKDGSTVIGSNVALDASGVAMFTTSALSAASHNLTAVYNGNGSFATSTSSPALVQVVNARPTASVSGSAAICPGSSTTIQAALGGASPWTVTWSDGLVQSGIAASPASRSVSPAATTVYSVTNVADAHCSNTGSGSATVTVNALPAISAQPAPRSACEGGTATFTVAASGSGITYRWRKDGVSLANGGHVAGATSATLTISSAAAADAGAYDVVVSGACPPAVTSNAASLTVNPVPTAIISAATNLCAGSTGNTAWVPGAGPGATYAWSISNGTITQGAGTSTVTYAAAPNGNSLTLNVTVTNASGCSASGSNVVTLSTGGVSLEDWKNIPAGTESWQSATLQTKDMMYPEGGTVPYRLTLPQPCVGSTWSITLQYDFADEATGVHFCDFLTSYNAYEGSVNGHPCMSNTCIGQTTRLVPADASLPYQMPGVFTVVNGTITGISAYSTFSTGGVTVKTLTLSGTAASSAADVMILFGAHMARDYEWGNNKGAHEWPSGTASLGFADYSGGAGGSTAGHTNVKISDNILDNPSQSDLSVVASDSPNPVNAGGNLTYSIIVNNSGPLASMSDTVTDVIPAGTRFVSAATPGGWNLTAPAAGGTGTVRWVLPTTFNAGASATFELVVAVDANATGTVENTAVLTAGNVDAYQMNNSSHTSTTIVSAQQQPVVSGATEQPNGGSGSESNSGELLPRGSNDRSGGAGGAVSPAPGAGPSGAPPEPGDGSGETPVLPHGAGGAGNGAGPAPASGTPAGPQSGQPAGNGLSGNELPAHAGALMRPSPNPFRSEMHMTYAVAAEAARVEVAIYDVTGRQVAVLADGQQSTGRHDVAWDGRDRSGVHVAKGIYFVRIQIGGQAQQVRVTSMN